MDDIQTYQCRLEDEEEVLDLSGMLIDPGYFTWLCCTNYVLKIYITLLKFDFCFFLGFTIQFVVIVVDRSNVEFYLTIAAIPVTVVILFMAAFFTRRENTLGMIAIIVSSHPLS